jgi:precorrin-6B methylase 2
MRDNEILTPEIIKNIASSFQQSRVILTAIELDIFTVIDNHLKSSSEVAKLIGADERATERLMNVLVPLGFLRKTRGKFYNTESSAKYLVKGKPDYMNALHHTNHLWNSWSSLTEVVKNGNNISKDKKSRSDDWRHSFIAAMHYRAQQEAKLIALLLNLSNVKKMLDIGGGSGAYSYEFMNHNSEMKAAIFDLPEIIPLTKNYAEQSGILDRMEFIEGDYLENQFGSGYDLILLSAIIHINSYEQNKNLIKRCADVLNLGGQIIIKDFIMSEDRTAPLGGTLFAINMLVNTKSGDTYTESEMRDWLINAGIKSIEKKETSFGSNLLIGVKK